VRPSTAPPQTPDIKRPPESLRLLVEPALDAAAGEGADRSLEPGATSSGHGAVPGFVPAQYAPILVRAAQRSNVSAAPLAAQLYAGSGFNPFAISPAGARGIAEFMPGTARACGLSNPLDATDKIDAQAHLMRPAAGVQPGPARARRLQRRARGGGGCGCIPTTARRRATSPASSA